MIAPNRTDIVKWWKNAFDNSGVNASTMTNREKLALIADCASREVAARIAAAGQWASVAVSSDEP